MIKLENYVTVIPDGNDPKNIIEKKGEAKDLQDLQQKLDEWADSQTERPTKEDFEGNPIYLKLMDLARKKADSDYHKGGCKKYSSRRRRFCANQASLGYDYCSLHRSIQDPPSGQRPSHKTEMSPAALSLQIKSNGKKSNLKRKLKRCLNPFLIPDIDAPPSWCTLLQDLNRPTWLDIGSAKGLYIKHLSDHYEQLDQRGALLDRKWNFIGVELFKPLTEAANQLYKKPNVTYIHANINKSLESLQIPNLTRVSLMFPDPWSCGKASNGKNRKKRVMNPDFAKRLAKLMNPGSDLYFASDWHDLALDIRSCLLNSGFFIIPKPPYPYIPSMTASELMKLQPGKKNENLIDTATKFDKDLITDGQEEWLDRIPFEGIQTERDLVCDAQWRRVFRLVVIRSHHCESEMD